MSRSDGVTGLQMQDVAPQTLSQFAVALAHLSDDLDDVHRMDVATLRNVLFGPRPSAYGALATDRAGTLGGAALFSPVVSTTAGAPGAYVSDLWIAPKMRGRSLGRSLLAYAAGRAQDLWGARFVRLVSYPENRDARAFYARLGFAEKTENIVLHLTGDAMTQFMETS